MNSCIAGATLCCTLKVMLFQSWRENYPSVPEYRQQKSMQSLKNTTRRRNKLTGCDCWGWTGAVNQLWTRLLKLLRAGTLSSSASRRTVTLLDDQCPRQVMLQTGWKADRTEEPQLLRIGPAAQPTAKWSHPSLIHTAICSQLSFTSPTIDFQNIFR